MTDTLQFPFPQIPDPTTGGRIIYNGKIYIGNPDTDPTNAVNQVRCFYLNEAEVEIDLSQPIATNTNGLTVNPSGDFIAVKIDTEYNKYSLAIHDRNDVEQYYIANMEEVNPDITIDIEQILIDDLSQAYEFPTIDDAIASTAGLPVDKTIHLKERTQGEGGGSTWYTVLSSSVTSDGNSIVQLSGANTLLSIQLDTSKGVDLLAIGCLPDGSDVESSLQAACDIGGLITGDGVFTVSSVNLTKDTNFKTVKGCTFRRLEGLDIKQSYHLGTDVAMFDITTNGLTTKFTGIVFDGNKQNQPVERINPGMAGATTEPTGFSIRLLSVENGGLEDSDITLIDCECINGTSGYLYIEGDDIQRRYRTALNLIRTEMRDTVTGYGRDDPATPTALGWNSDYVGAYGYVEINTHDITLEYLAGQTPVGAYAPIGMRISYYHGSAATAGQGELSMTGKTTITGLGRKSESYDGLQNATSNAIGAIDLYGEGRHCYIENLVGTNNEYVTIRAKSTIDTYTVLVANLTDCWRGLQVGPAPSTGAGSDVTIGTLTATGGTIPQLEIVGNSTSDRVRSAQLGNINIKGGTNPEALTTNNGSLTLRNIARADVSSCNIYDAPVEGVYLNGIYRLKARLTVNTAVNYGILGVNMGSFTIEGSVASTGNYGLNMSGTPDLAKLRDFEVDGCVDYGVFLNFDTNVLSVDNCNVINVSGLDRGYYIKAGGRIENCDTDTAIPLFSDDVQQVDQTNNSFTNTRNRYHTIAPTWTGVTGDFVWDLNPVSGQTYTGWSYASGAWREAGGSIA